jgi:probable F420-dependent oxidoreductase
MLYGLCTLATEDGILPAELGKEAEERAMESVWFADHTHIPAKRETPWPGGPDLPPAYFKTIDPLVCMAFATAATTRLRAGSGVLLLIERDPIVTAKTIASIDLLSNGRVDIGIGGGWNFEEMRNHGTDPKTRWLLLRERVEAMVAMWTQEPAEYHGQLVDFDPIHSRPKPVQKPHPPIHVGGAGPQAYKRALRYGQGWFPMLGRGDDDFVKHIAALREEARAMGRSLDGFQLTVFSVAFDADLIRRYEQAGIQRVLFSVPGDDRERAKRALDRASETIAKLSS